MADSNASRASDTSSWRVFLTPSNARLLALVFVGTVLFAFANYILAVSIPKIVAELGGVRWVSWFASLFTGAAILSTLATPALINRFSGRRMVFIATGIYGLGAILAAVAPNIGALLVSRILLGFGGGFAFGFSAVFIRRCFDPVDWPKAFSAISIAFGLSAVFGPLIGGLFAEAGFWRAGFWLLLVLALSYVFIAFAALRDPRADRFHREPNCARLPLKRLGLVGAIVLLISAANQFSLPLALCAVVAGLIAFWAFLRADANTSNSRLLPGNPFKPGTLHGAGFTFILVIAAATIAFFTYGTLLIKGVFDISAVAAGYILVLETFGWSVAATIVAGLPDRQAQPYMRWGPWCVVFGTACLAAGFLVAVLPLVIVGALMSGVGMGMAYANITRLVVVSLNEDERDIASAAIVTTQQLGFVFGAGLSGLIANSQGIERASDPNSIGAIGFWLIAAFLPLALYAAWQTRVFTLLDRR